MSTAGRDPVDSLKDLAIVLGVAVWVVVATPFALWKSAKLVRAYELDLRNRRTLARALGEGYVAARPCYACHLTWYQGCDH